MIMKRKLIILSTACLSLISFISCESLVDVDNMQTVSKDENYQTSNDVNASILGVYTQLQSVAEQCVILGELRSGYLELTAAGIANSDLADIVNNSVSIDNTYADAAPFYSVIRSCNDILANIDEVSTLDPSFTDSIKEHYRAEIIGVRNYVYFCLGKIFGEAYYYEDAVSEAGELPDYTVMDISTLVSTLITSQSAIMSSYDTSIEDDMSTDWQRSRFGLYAAHTLLADLSLFRASMTGSTADYQAVLDNLYVVMNINSETTSTQTFKVGSDFSGSNWVNIFSSMISSTSEVIWGIDFSKTYSQTHSLQDIFNTNAAVTVSESMLDKWESSDPRSSITVKDDYTVGKYCVDKDDLDDDAPVIIYRAAEVHLMYAEALCYLGYMDEALTIVNEGNSSVEYTTTGAKTYNAASLGVRGRMGLSSSVLVVTEPDVVKGITVDIIRNERLCELAFEGKTWGDMLRYAILDGSTQIEAGSNSIPQAQWYLTHGE